MTSVAPSRALLGDAVLMDVRPLPRLPMVLLNFRTVLDDKDWTLHFMHGPRNHQAVRDSPRLLQYIASGGLRLRRFTIRGVAVDESVDYNDVDHYQQTYEFWSSFSRPLLLMFEADAALCPSPTLPLHTFYNYTFVGAPWLLPYRTRAGTYSARKPKDPHYPKFCFNLEHCSGNSGLSLWRRDVMANLLANTPGDHTSVQAAHEAVVLDYLEQPCVRCRAFFRPKRGHLSLRPGNATLLLGRQNGGSVRAAADMGTDVWFSHMLQALWHYGRLPIPAVPPEEVSARFAVETFYASEFTPVGVHKAYRYLDDDELGRLMRRCRPARDLLRAMIQESGNSTDWRAWSESEKARFSSVLLTTEAQTSVAGPWAGQWGTH